VGLLSSLREIVIFFVPLIGETSSDACKWGVINTIEMNKRIVFMCLFVLDYNFAIITIQN
jgi:hypothetical protein